MKSKGWAETGKIRQSRIDRPRNGLTDPREMGWKKKKNEGVSLLDEKERKVVRYSREGRKLSGLPSQYKSFLPAALADFPFDSQMKLTLVLSREGMNFIQWLRVKQGTQLLPRVSRGSRGKGEREKVGGQKETGNSGSE